MKKVLIALILAVIKSVTLAQYAPKAGEIGSTAIFKDSNIIHSWASTVYDSTRGWLNISNKPLGKTSVGNAYNMLNKADNLVFSLGDSGIVTLQFSPAIVDGDGFDFVVFENSFDGLFLEFAHVEISEDGINFYRFPSHSLSDTLIQTQSFGLTETEKINNLAGKYIGSFGTPFDLTEVENYYSINFDSINYVRVIDVVGSLNSSYATKDAFGNKINDPFPTEYPSGGFDLDAIGVMHNTKTTGFNNLNYSEYSIYPNPLKSSKKLHINGLQKSSVFIVYNIKGEVIKKGYCLHSIDCSDINAGFYWVYLNNKVSKICIY